MKVARTLRTSALMGLLLALACNEDGDAIDETQRCERPSSAAACVTQRGEQVCTEAITYGRDTRHALWRLPNGCIPPGWTNAGLGNVLPACSK